ncbi:LPS export ABC transporter periplasmic protein LptC [Fulvimarina sp. 2208YS6-2-32]|uniref:LPS export ABC transporter periplasmic protein LptC n=1 Tax=Fulvimarina uroteuthidis TaxID=3098149 RepID=A0ABU5HYB7_9HYPH|nr:LPS export ABC transporter periplasmic protein LptC [Fulvimarina sp. 2208YS6-2-32]MDY8108122.1 LPS export ABC transporter periplasmic protein LptC [Fulvimarina sp. 2208YS6-2-32]
MTDSRGQDDEPRSREVDWASADSAAGNAKIAREFEKAARSGRRSRILKFVLPLLAVLIVIGGIGVTLVARVVPDGVNLAGATIQDGRVVMDDPRMSGVDSNDRPFELVAQKAMQAITGGAVDLEGIDAKISVSEDTTAMIRASAGHYDPNEQKLDLSGGLTVETNDGLSVSLRSAGIDLADGSMTTRDPVHIRTADQDIKANGMTLSDNGERVQFFGGVSIILKPAGAADETDQALTIIDESRLAEAAPIASGEQ